MKPIIVDCRKENSPHFAEDISFINNKSNTYYGDESSSILEAISAMKDKDLKKVINLDGSDVKEVSEETNDKSKSQFNEEKIKTPDVTTRKSTFKKNLTEESNKRPQNEDYDEVERKKTFEERRKTGKSQEDTQNAQINDTVEKRKTIKNEEDIKTEENSEKNQDDLQNIERKKTIKDEKNSNEILLNPENSTRKSFKTQENVANERKKTLNNEKEHILQNDLNKPLNREHESTESPLENNRKKTIQPFQNEPKVEIVREEEAQKELSIKEGNNETAEKTAITEISQQERKKTIQEKDDIKNKEKVNDSKNDSTDIIPKDVGENNNKSSTETTKPQIVQPKIIDRGRQRKEEFERKMKEKQTTENKLQTLKQKFQTTPQIIAEENNTTNNNLNKKTPLTPKEINVPEEKKFDLEALDRNLKQKLVDLQKPEEKKEMDLKLQENQKTENKGETKAPSENENPEKAVISLKNYRDQLKSKKNEAEKVEVKPESKYVINSRGQKINKNLTGLIDMLEKTLAGDQNTTAIPKIERAESNMEHLTMERSNMGHKRMKSKNTEFFEQI